MKIDIWSDIRCPFCYIGKRKFEKALDKFPQKEEIDVQWHSFELDPSLTTNAEINAVEHLAAIKGISKAEAEGMTQYVTQAAKEAGLSFNFEKNIVANSFNAHRLIQLAKTNGLAGEAEEALFKAHFTEGKNIDDKNTLIETGVAIGLQEDEVEKIFNSDAFSKEVRQDEMQAQSIGVHGVPFFIFNNKYAVSGAQSPENFLHTLKQAWEEFEKENKKLIVTEGESCSADGTCN